jgi:tRNA(Arg) A34 adenosine deaminase TadA
VASTKQNMIATIYDKSGKILSVATNSYQKSHPRQAELANRVGMPDKIYLHAEISAIIKCKENGKPYRIKVERFNKHGETMLARPCEICQLAIKLAGIKFVEYSL